jgi:hypothetical protein
MAHQTDRWDVELMGVRECPPWRDRRTATADGLHASLRRAFSREVPHLWIGQLMLNWKSK